MGTPRCAIPGGQFSPEKINGVSPVGEQELMCACVCVYIVHAHVSVYSHVCMCVCACVCMWGRGEVNHRMPWWAEMDQTIPSSPFPVFSGRLPGILDWKSLHDPKLVDLCPITP